MIIYAAALAVMFICQNGLTSVIQAPPRRPRAPRKAASRGPPKRGDVPNPLGSINITTTTRPTRWFLLALASVSLARAGHESEETYVIQALRPEAIPSLDAAVPDGVSRLALSAGSNNSTRVDYAIARTGRRKGVAQIHRLRPSDCAGADFVSLQYRVVEPQSVENYVGLRLVLYEGSNCEQSATAERCASDVDLLEQYHSYHFMLDDTSQEWKELRVGLCGDEDPRSPFWRLDRFGAAGDGHLDPAALRGWQLKFVGADQSLGEAVAGAVEIKELSCLGSGLVGAMLEQPWAEPAAGARWQVPHTVAAVVADGDVSITYAEPTRYAMSRTLPDDSYYKLGGAVIAYETDATATFELLDGSEPVSGTGRGSLTVGAMDGAHITGLRLTVDATTAGNTSFSNLRGIGATGGHNHDHAYDCRDSDDQRCAHVEGVFLDADEATRTIPFGHRECCQLCLDEPNCTFYSVAAGSSVASFTPSCHLFAAPRVVKLAEETMAERAMSTHWVLDRQRRGELCEVCTCTETSADCRGRDLRTVPFSDDDGITRLDLRDNEALAVIPAGALTGLRALEEVLLPVDVKYVAPDASAPDVAIVAAAGTRANVVADASEFFASECCGLGAPTGGGGHFCDEQIERDAPGADAEFYEGYTFASETIYLQITPSSAHFGEAAASPELCASYCAMSETCWAFTHTEPKRAMTLLTICRMHTKDALDLPLEDLSDRRQTWTAGVPPRTRKLRGARGARVVAPKSVDAERDGDQYRAEFEVRLGTAPTRGAIWVTPEVRPRGGSRPLGRTTFDPPRFALYHANASVLVTMTAVTKSRNLDVSLSVVSCDKAFDDVEEAVHVRLPQHHDDDDKSDKHRRRARRTERAAIIAAIVVGAALLLGCALAGGWYVNRSLSEKDRLQAERRVTVQQQVTAARERVGDCVETKFGAPHAIDATLSP